MCADDASSVLVVVNDNSALSKTIGEYYVRRRAIPLRQICHLKVDPAEEIARVNYERLIAAPIGRFLIDSKLVESILWHPRKYRLSLERCRCPPRPGLRQWHTSKTLLGDDR